MSKPANKVRGEVAVPELGDGVFIRFSMDAIERLCSEYPDGWAETVSSLESIDQIPLAKKVLQTILVEPHQDADLTPLAGAFHPVCEAIKEAMAYAMYGKSREEALADFEAKQAEEVRKKLEKLGEDPQMAAAIAFLQRYGSQDTEPGSGQTKSAA